MWQIFIPEGIDKQLSENPTLPINNSKLEMLNFYVFISLRPEILTK